MPPRPALPALRRYATVVSAPSTSAAPPTSRVYTERKAFLYAYYTHLLQRSQMVLLFSHANLSVAESGKIRRALASLPLPPTSSVDPADPSAAEAARATMTVARTGLLAPVVRRVQSKATQFDAKLLEGQTALITCPSLSPGYLKTILGTVEKAIKSAQSAKKDDKNPNVKLPELTLLAGVAEGSKLLDAKGVRELATLPELDQLRGQLVGLLQAPQRQLAGILTAAGGGQLVRTLQGLEESLKEKDA